MSMLNKRGATKHPEIKKIIADKLKKAKTAKKGRVDALKAAFAAKEVVDLDDDLAQIMTDVTDSQLKQHGTITARTVMMIDKSASMEDAIALSKEIGCTLAQACEHLYAYMFDTMPTEIEFDRKSMTTKSAWDERLKMFPARGGTDPSAVIRTLIINNIRIDQILLITDEGENQEGKFANQLKNYEKHFGFMPNVVIVRLGDDRRGYPYGSCDRIEKSCKRLNIDVDVMKCKDIDQVAIPNLLQLLSRKSVFELVQEILSLSLPNRSDWDKKHGKQATPTKESAVIAD